MNDDNFYTSVRHSYEYYTDNYESLAHTSTFIHTNLTDIHNRMERSYRPTIYDRCPNSIKEAQLVY